MTDEQPISRRAAREAARGNASQPPAQPPFQPPFPPPSADLPTASSAVPFGAPGAPDAAPTTLLVEAPPAEGAEAPAAEPAAARGGIGAMLRKHPVAWTVGASAVVFALLGTGAVFAGAAWAARDASEVVVPVDEVDVPDRSVPAGFTGAGRLRTCSVAGPASDPRLVSLAGSVVRADTGEVLFDRAGAAPAATGTAQKVLTAAAAVARLGADYQVTTSVYEGSVPGTIVLVGRGDATLSALPAGQESVYPGAPKLATLAKDTVASYRAKYPDTPITTIVLDASYWNPGDRWDETWDRSLQTRGLQSEVTALQIDGDRADPRAAESPRSTDPIGRVGAAFITALLDADVDGDVVDPGVATTTGTAVGTTTLAEVKSRPIRDWITQMLLTGDNTLAEMLARIVSRESDMGGGASSLQQAIPAALMNYELSTTGLAVRDGSGLSASNAVPPQIVADLMRKVRDGGNGLDVVRSSLSVAGKTGPLGDRFSGDNAEARGNVTGMSGTLGNASTLMGYLTATDGTPLAFSFTASGDGLKANDARAAIDTLTTAVLRCGDNLSSN